MVGCCSHLEHATASSAWVRAVMRILSTHMRLCYECVFVPLKVPAGLVSRPSGFDGQVVGHQNQPASDSTDVWRRSADVSKHQAAAWHRKLPHRFLGLVSPLSIEALEPRGLAPLKDRGPPPSRSMPPAGKLPDANAVKSRYDPPSEAPPVRIMAWSTPGGLTIHEPRRFHIADGSKASQGERLVSHRHTALETPSTTTSRHQKHCYT